MQRFLDRRERDIHDGDVDDDHELDESQDEEGLPAAWVDDRTRPRFGRTLEVAFEYGHDDGPFGFGRPDGLIDPYLFRSLNGRRTAFIP